MKRTFQGALLLLCLIFLEGKIAMAQSVYDIEFKSISGQSLPLSAFKGKVLLVVNTASRCGYTKQYGGLQELYAQYADAGLVVLGVPSNDFSNQEPGSNEEIKTFCEVNFNITFPMTEKVVVTGNEAHPFFQWATANGGSKPRWNFSKYLIGRDGRLVDSYSAITTPAGLKKDIEKALAQPTP